MKNIPAFPRPYSPSTSAQEGMTLRDYFAAKAMQGMIANNARSPIEIAQSAYIVADFMLKAREA